MSIISKDELRKIAHISQLRLYDSEVDPLINQIADVLTYAQCVKTAAYDVQYEQRTATMNIFRSDVVHQAPTDVCVAAPEIEQHYFVVPRVLDNK